MYWARLEWLIDEQPSLERLSEAVAQDMGLAVVLVGGLLLLALIALFGPRRAVFDREDNRQSWPANPPPRTVAGSSRRRPRSGPLTPLSPQTYNLLVADLENDASGEATDRLVDGLGRAFEDMSESLPVVVMAAREALPDAGQRATAGDIAELLRRHRAHLFIDGRYDSERQSVQLNSMSASGLASARGTWPVPVALPRSTILAADLALASVEGRASHRDAERLLAPVAESLKWVVATNPPTLTALDKSRLLLGRGQVWQAIAAATGERDGLNVARDSYLLHLKTLQQGGIPTSAPLKANLGLGHSLLSLAEASGEENDVNEAIAAFRAAMGTEDNPADETSARLARVGLAKALALSGLITGDNNRLGESITAARDALKSWPHHIDSANRADLESTLGQTLLALAAHTGAAQARDEGVARLREAANHYRSVGQFYRVAAINGEIAATETRLPLKTTPKVELPPLPPPVEREPAPAPAVDDPQVVRSRRLGAIDEFISRHRTALRSLNAEKDGAQWTQVQFQLADAMAERGELVRDAQALRDAQSAMEKARASAAAGGAVYLTARADDCLSRIARTAAFHGLELTSPPAPPPAQPPPRGEETSPDAAASVAEPAAAEPVNSTPAGNAAQTAAEADANANATDAATDAASGVPPLQEDRYADDDTISVADTGGATGGAVTPPPAAPLAAQVPPAVSADADSVPTEIRASSAPTTSDAAIAPESAPVSNDQRDDGRGVSAASTSFADRALMQRIEANHLHIDRLTGEGMFYRAARARDAQHRGARALALKDMALAREAANEVTAELAAADTQAQQVAVPPRGNAHIWSDGTVYRDAVARDDADRAARAARMAEAESGAHTAVATDTTPTADASADTSSPAHAPVNAPPHAPPHAPPSAGLSFRERRERAGEADAPQVAAPAPEPEPTASPASASPSSQRVPLPLKAGTGYSQETNDVLQYASPAATMAAEQRSLYREAVARDEAERAARARSSPTARVANGADHTAPPPRALASLSAIDPADMAALTTLRSARKALAAIESAGDDVQRARVVASNSSVIADALRFFEKERVSTSMISDVQNFVDATIARARDVNAPYLGALARDVGAVLAKRSGGASSGHEGG